MTRSMKHVLLVAALSVGLSAPVASAGVFDDIAVGLGALNFDLRGQHNFLSGGADFAALTQFQGNPLDFGAGDLTLNGPLSFEVSTGNRFVNTLDISFQTALTSDLASSPLTYEFNADMCGQETNVLGSVLIDSNLSLNEFGCYKLDLQYSSRQTVANDGRFNDDSITNDFDLGPISVQGNIFIDAFALLLDPILTRDGRENPFAPYTAQAQLEEATLKARELAASGIVDEPATAGASLLPGLGVQSASGLSYAVPEPMTLTLAAIGLAVITAKPLRRRFLD